MKKLIIGITVALFSFSAYAESIIDVKAIAGKSKYQVSNMIGTPFSCKKSKYGEKCQFKTAETEIVFINGKADWITIEGLDSYPFSNQTLSTIGLKPAKPTFSNSFSMRWEPHQGYLSVSLFKGGSKSDYAYIKVLTK